MDKFIFILLIIYGPDVFSMENKLTLPWSEFKAVYAEHLKDQLGLEDKDSEEERLEPVVVIEAADYEISVDNKKAAIEVRLQGKILQGEPEPLELFDDSVSVIQIAEIFGATLICHDNGYQLFFTGQENFSLRLKLALPVQEDKRSQFLQFTIPQAVKNSLSINAPENIRIIEALGTEDAKGKYFFPPTDELIVRLQDRVTEIDSHAGYIDTFTRIEIEDNRYLLTTYFAPLRPVTSTIKLKYQRPLEYFDTSLKTSWVRRINERELEIKLPNDWNSLFTIKFETAIEDKGVFIKLPLIAGNRGRQGEFQLIEPAEVDILVTASDLKQNLPITRLPERVLHAFAGDKKSYMRVSANESIRFRLKRFETVQSPDIVLEELHLYTSFTENGDIISVIRLHIPDNDRDKLYLNPIPGAEIWSLTVNDVSRKLFTHEQGDWIIPLPANGQATIELAYLVQGERLKLKGTLPVNVPAIGIAARQLLISIGLAEQVDLIAMEGELLPTEGEDWPRVKHFTGMPYYFKYPLYRGKAINNVIYYKEQLDMAGGQS